MLINDLKAHLTAHRADIDLAIARVLDSGWLVLGPEVRGFEEEFAALVGVPHACAVANGTDALELALRAVGVQDGDLVATVANAGMYTCTALAAIGAQPFFLDVDDADLLVSMPEVERALGSGIRAFVLTHLYGRAVPHAAEVAARCRERGIAVVEDCAQAHGARLRGGSAGAFSDAASFSFYPTKNLGALGDAGAVVSRRPEVVERVAQLRQYGWNGKYKVDVPGGRNSRLDELQAAILRVLLPRLDGWNASRRHIASTYSARISQPLVRLPSHRDGRSDVSHLYVVRTPMRASLADWLRSKGVSSDVHYPVPDHRQKVFRGRFSEVDLPVTEKAAAEILTLPCFPEMTQDQIDAVIEAVNSWPGHR